MAERLNWGEIWLHEFSKPDKRRPVLILTRPNAIRFLNTVTVASITSTIRGIASEVQVGVEEGLKQDCVVNLHNVQTVQQSDLRTFIGTVSRAKMAQVCRALFIATGCR
jgi:mRNA interferase MazF